MKPSLVLLSTLLFVSSLSAQELKTDSKIVEETILWQTSYDSTFTPIEMAKLLSDTSRFKKEGNFYKVNSTLKVFGFESIYLGMIGINYMLGPNATLKGTPKEISEKIAKSYNYIFEVSPDKSSYKVDLINEISLIITKHPTLKNATMVIGSNLRI